MMSGLKINSIAAAVGLAAVLEVLVAAIPAHAADPSFPTGSLVGLVPPAGMVLSKRFPGFEDLDKNASIVFATLPAAAYAEMDKTAQPDVLKKQGIAMDKREPMQVNVGKAFLVIGSETADKTRFRKWILVAATDRFTALVNVQVPEQDTTYTDAAVRAALATLAVRASVPDAERLSLLPFTVGDLAGFQVEGVIPDRALMLVDIPANQAPDATARTVDARLLVAAEPGGPSDTDDHGNFARLAFDSIGGIKNVRINMSEPLNLNGQQGYQTMAQAKQIQDDADVMVVQWLRFGSGGFLQMVGIARSEIWTSALTRMRAVRDSVEAKER
jgi:hypothetical protein